MKIQHIHKHTHTHTRLCFVPSAFENMSAEAETKLKLPPLLSLKYAQTLSHSYRVRSLDIRVCAIKDMNMNSTTTASAAAAAAAILIVGLCNGEVIIYNALLSTSTTTTSSTTQCIQFTLLKCLRAHNDVTTSLHFHRSRLLFASASLDADVKVWSLNNMKRPRLIKRLWHVSPVCCVRYSQSGNLLTGCLHGWLRVFEPEPLFSLRWKFHGAQPVRSVAWSPSNGIAASFGFKHLRDIGFIQVQDSTVATDAKTKTKTSITAKISSFNLFYVNDMDKFVRIATDRDVTDAITNALCAGNNLELHLF